LQFHTHTHTHTHTHIYIYMKRQLFHREQPSFLPCLPQAEMIRNASLTILDRTHGPTKIYHSWPQKYIIKYIYIYIYIYHSWALTHKINLNLNLDLFPKIASQDISYGHIIYMPLISLYIQKEKRNFIYQT